MIINFLSFHREDGVKMVTGQSVRIVLFCNDNIFVLNSFRFAESMGEKKLRKSSKKVLTFGLKVV